jgi:hypothetical protein
MRSDMAKVIVDRPRRGARFRYRKGYRKEWKRLVPDEWPKRESIYAQSGRSKSFNEHLSPLRRFLEKQVGRPWDKVFAEICQHLRVDSVIQGHVRDHVEDFVVTLVIEIDGVLCHGQGWCRGRPLQRRYGPLLYVCPRTGLLRKVKKRKVIRQKRAPEVVRVGDSREYRLIDGIWYEVTLRPITAEAAMHRDQVLRMTVNTIDRWKALKTYGAVVYADARRQLNKKEIRRLGLRGQ